MNRLTSLLLIVAPWLAVTGGAVLLALGSLHLAGAQALPGIPAEARSPAVACLLLGLSLAGLGGTYLLTGGETGHDHIYLAWIALATVSGFVGMLGNRS